MTFNPHVERISRACFPEMLASLRAVLSDASFVAFDTELTGLSAQLNKPSLMDSVEQRYAQLRKSVEAFAVVQFGLSCFTWSADARAFHVRTFQFPIFPVVEPLPHASGSSARHSELPDRRFLAQAKCMMFIRSHGFDLNAWVDEGIGYLSHHEQQQLAEELDRPLREDVAARFKGDASTAIRTAESDKFLKAMRKRIRSLADLHMLKHSKATAPDIESDSTAATEQFLSEKIPSGIGRHAIHRDGGGIERRVFVTEPQMPFRRSALFALVEKEFPSALVLDCPADNDGDAEVEAAPWKRRLRVVDVEGADEKNAIARAHERILQREHVARRLSLVGFTTLFDLLVEAGKPLVGHNLLLDLMHCFDKFHGPLPSSCSQFVFEVDKWLGSVAMFDTKVLVEHAMEHVDVFSERVEHSALEYVYETVTKEPFQGPVVRNAVATADNIKDTPLSSHQAGYDAFMTGAVFLRVCSGLGVPNDVVASIGSLAGDRHENAAPRWKEAMLQLRNSIKMSQLLPSVTLRRPGPYPAEIKMPGRVSFLRVELTRAWTPKLKGLHIQQCVARALNLRSPKLVAVRYETKTSVFVHLPTSEQVDALLKIRKECKEVQGSARDPLPSLGCVDLFRIPDAVSAKTSAIARASSSGSVDEPAAKRHKHS